MNGWWLHQLYNSPDGPVLVVAWIFWVIFSITLHELAHGWAALWQGDDTPRRLGHMNMNPLTHMGGYSLLVFALVGIAWGQMPVDPSRFRWRRKGNIVVSGAGPAMNLLLAFVALTAAALWVRYGSGGGDLQRNIFTFLQIGGMLNIALAAFNLIPIPPLDGSTVLAGFSFRAWRFYRNPQVQMFSNFAFLALFLSGIGGLLFDLADDLSARYVIGVSSILPK